MSELSPFDEMFALAPTDDDLDARLAGRPVTLCPTAAGRLAGRRAQMSAEVAEALADLVAAAAPAQARELTRLAAKGEACLKAYEAVLGEHCGHELSAEQSAAEAEALERVLDVVVTVQRRVGIRWP